MAEDLSRLDLLRLAQQVTGWARNTEDLEAYVARASDCSVRAFGEEIESFSQATSAGMGIRVVSGNRQGFAYAGSLDVSVLEDTLAEARDNAVFATPDEHVALARPDGVAPQAIELWSEELAGFPAKAKVELALELERRVKEGDRRIRQVEQANYGDALLETAVSTSTGISVASRQTACYVSAYAIATDGDDTQTGGGYSVGRSPAELDTGKAATEAVERATRLLGARKARSRRLTVVFDRRVTSILLAILSSPLSGDAVAKGRSLFTERAGEKVATGSVTLVDDPTNPFAYGASVFDAEGLACRRNVVIDGGVLQGFLYDTYSARRAGTASTASAVRSGFKSGPGVGCRALGVEPGPQDQEQVIASVGEGLFVQSVAGVHSGVNPISGDFSVGAEGLMIKDGSLAEPVREVTIASTIQRMLLDILAIGSDLEWLPGIASGMTLAIADMSLSGS